MNSDDDDQSKHRLRLNLKSVKETVAKEIKILTAVFKQEHKELKDELLLAIGAIIDDKLSVLDKRMSNLEAIVIQNEQFVKDFSLTSSI